MTIQIQKWKKIALILAVMDVFVWSSILSARPSFGSSFYFLDVGQGDSELLIMDGVTVLVDAGPDKKVNLALSDVLPKSRHYIDIGIITHPQLDHYGGFKELFGTYKFGMIVTNGRDADNNSKEWASILEQIEQTHTPLLFLGAGDKIKYLDNEIVLLSPDDLVVKNKELNDTAIVLRARIEGISLLLSSDIGENIERLLVKSGMPIKSDILKVGHHGSKYSSGKLFLDKVAPLAAFIEVGARNPYRHPTKEALGRLASSTVRGVFRTDINGTISVIPQSGELIIYTEK